MQSIIVISLLVLVITVFTISSVNGAPSKLKRQDTGTTNSTSPVKARSPVKRDTNAVRAKRAPAVHLPQKRSVPSSVKKPKTTKRTPSSTSKTTTVQVKKSIVKSKVQGARKKRLSTWEWV